MFDLSPTHELAQSENAHASDSEWPSLGRRDAGTGVYNGELLKSRYT